MDANEIRTQVKTVMDTFGMTAVKAAEVMDVPYGQFRKKVLEMPGRNFTEANLTALIEYIKAEAAKL